MKLGVVRDHDNLLLGALADSAEGLQKGPARLGARAVRLPLELESPIGQPHGAELAHLLSRGVVQRYGIAHLGRNPHPATGSVLLKVDFVQCPELHRGILLAEDKLTVTNGTQAPKRLAQTISSGEATLNDTVPFEVLDDIKVVDTVVVTKGTTALGSVTIVQPKRRMWRAGKLDIALESVPATSGDKIQLTGQ